MDRPVHASCSEHCLLLAASDSVASVLNGAPAAGRDMPSLLHWLELSARWAEAVCQCVFFLCLDELDSPAVGLSSNIIWSCTFPLTASSALTFRVDVLINCSTRLSTGDGADAFLALSGWYTEACVCMRAAAMSAFPSGT
mmetsp:Transcript_22132/g.56732  ORF Transcript_22132/g.56732 Transcript_22132/m.56732 type:complete len:140 (-) Transcript_22132:458-877(-)